MRFYQKAYKLSLMSLVVLTTLTTRVGADPATLYIKNPSNVSVSVSVVAANGDIQGSIGSGVLQVSPGRTEALHTGRNSAKSGSVGAAYLIFEPRPIGTSAIMHVHGGGGVAILPQHSNRYPGKFHDWTKKYDGKNHNTYVLAKPPAKRARTFKWVQLCSYPTCNGTHEKTYTREVVDYSDTEVEKSIATNMSICIDVAGAGAVYSASTHACIDSQNNTRRSSKLGNKLTKTESDKFDYTWPESTNPAMKNLKVESIWYFVTLDNPGNGWTNQQPVAGELFKDERTCPSGSRQPTYHKDDKPQKDSCTRL